MRGAFVGLLRDDPPGGFRFGTQELAFEVFVDAGCPLTCALTCAAVVLLACSGSRPHAAEESASAVVGVCLIQDASRARTHPCLLCRKVIGSGGWGGSPAGVVVGAVVCVVVLAGLAVMAGDVVTVLAGGVAAGLAGVTGGVMTSVVVYRTDATASATEPATGIAGCVSVSEAVAAGAQTCPATNIALRICSVSVESVCPWAGVTCARQVHAPGCEVWMCGWRGWPDDTSDVPSDCSGSLVVDPGVSGTT